MSCAFSKDLPQAASFLYATITRKPIANKRKKHRASFGESSMKKHACGEECVMKKKKKCQLSFPHQKMLEMQNKVAPHAELWVLPSLSQSCARLPARKCHDWKSVEKGKSQGKSQCVAVVKARGKRIDGKSSSHSRSKKPANGELVDLYLLAVVPVASLVATRGLDVVHELVLHVHVTF